MERVLRPDMRRDRSSMRRCVAPLLENVVLENNYEPIGRQNWIARWTKVGDDHCLLGDLNIKKGAVDEAVQAWLSALTAFEIARRLLDDDDPHREEVSAKVDAGVQKFGSLRMVERVKIGSFHHAEPLLFRLRAGTPETPAPAAICISKEDEAGTALLGRLLPAVIERGMSVLVVSHSDVSAHARGQSEAMLSCCLDYLSDRADVDSTRIGIYGEGLSAVLATQFAVFDTRLAAAVCDGGLWNWARILASVSWMTRAAGTEVDEHPLTPRRSQFMRLLKCPALVVAGGRGILDVSEAIKLQSDCTAAGIDMELVIPEMIKTPEMEIEDFVTSDDRIFGWLEHKLARNSAANPCL